MKTEIAKYKFRDGLPQEFEMFNISDLYRKHKKLHTVPHRPDFYQIIWIQTGEAVYEVDFNHIELSKNSLLFVPKNGVNLFDKNAFYEGRVIAFTDNFFCKEQEDMNFLYNTILFHDLYEISHINTESSNQIFNKLFELMENEYNCSNDKFHYDILRNYLHLFLLQSEREKRKQGFKEVNPGSDLDYLLLFKEVLEKRFKKFKSVDKYAVELSVSVNRLNKASLQTIGKSPKQLIDERILLEAKRLLTHSTLSIKEIAFELGFREPTNFIKYFRKHNHITPVEFRENFKL
jgi:AraC family transcriptional regulator, transcriptional activator of pobA